MLSVFRQGVLGRHVTPSLFVATAAGEGLCDEGGHATPKLVERYRELGKGGLGLIITGHAFVSRAGKMRPGQIGIDRDECIPGLAAVAREAGREGSLTLLQLAHGGMMCSADLTGARPVGPSSDVGHPSARSFETEEVDGLVQTYAEAARRAQRAGFHGVELHAAHGYLLSQFLSPLYNRRNDAYGGSPENRCRVLVEILRAIRGECGDDFLVGVKLNGSDLVAGGVAPEDACRHAVILEGTGADFLEVSGGICTSPDPACSAMRRIRQEDCYFAEFSREMKAHVSLPVICVGGIRRLATADALVAQGWCDFVGLCRPLIREPGLIQRWRQGEEEPSRCVSCNACVLAARSAGLVCRFRPQR